MENPTKIDPNPKFLALNCIDLSSSDVHQSVSLLKQVICNMMIVLVDFQFRFVFCVEIEVELLFGDWRSFLFFQACLDTGFFYAVNHGITEEFMHEVFAQSKRLFSLPLSDKMKLLRNEKHRGYTPILDELLDPDNQIRGIFCAIRLSSLIA